MKSFLVCALLSISSSFTFASPLLSENMFSVENFNFAAPVVKDKSQLTNLLEFGSIVYDTATQSFYGLDNVGAWAQLGVSPSAVRSEIFVQGYSSYGSTNTMIPVFSNIINNTGSAITYTTSGANGDSFTINQTAIYTVTIAMQSSVGGSVSVGITKNETSTMSTDVYSLNFGSPVLCLSVTPSSAGTTSVGSCTWTGLLLANDVIRPHTNGNVPNTSKPNWFHITKIGN